MHVQAVVSEFNPYLIEKVGADKDAEGMNIETPLFVFEAKDDTDSKRLTSVLDPTSTQPHVFQLAFSQLDSTASNLQTHMTGEINIDVFSVKDIDRHGYILSLLPFSNIMVAVDFYNVQGINLHVSDKEAK